MDNIKKTFVGGKMNLDVDERLLKDGEYREAVNIEIAHSEGSDVGAIEKALSNKKLTNLNLGNNPITLGKYEDEFRDKIYWFVLSDDGAFFIEHDYKNGITSYVLHDTRPIGNGRVLDLKADKLITGISKIINENENDDLILLTDDNIEPICLNVARAKTYGENGFEKEDIYLIKKPPRFAPTAQLTYTGDEENKIKDNFFSFGTRYKYLDGEYSAISSFTNYQFSPNKFELDYATMENKGMINTFNAVRIGFKTGDKRVTDVQLILKKSNSNILYIIETFNKKDKGWDNDNETKYFTFANNQSYIVLPEKEIYRSFDNVPRKAKSLEVIQNYPVLGNYLEGFNLVDKYGKDVILDYDVTLNTKPITLLELSFIKNTTSYTDDTITFNIDGNDLKEGIKLIFDFNTSAYNPNATDGKYIKAFEFILNRDYIDMNDLATDSSFVLFVNTVMTNHFKINYELTPPDFVVDIDISSFVLLSSTINTISIKLPTITYTIDNTPNDGDATDGNTHTDIYSWYFKDISKIYYTLIAIRTSVKSNRSLEVGLIYIGKFGRKTIVLTNEYNTIQIPHRYATTQNKIRVDIKHNPPEFADRYKVVVKQNKGIYHTIYASVFYEDGLFRWVLLEGSNKDKVKEGDILIVKSDLNGFVDKLIEVIVIEVSIKEKGFLEGNTTIAGQNIEELGGLYFKIKPSGFNMNSDENIYLSYDKYNAINDHKAQVLLGVPNLAMEGSLCGYLNETTNLYEDYKITTGTRVSIKFIASYRDEKNEYIKDFISQDNYDNFMLWWEAEVVDLGDQSDNIYYTFDRGLKNQLLLYVNNDTSGSFWHRSKIHCTIDIILSDGTMVFETKPEDYLGLYYETAQTFEILNSKHQGNKQNQTDTSNAIIELDFFNCYVQGNGVESYRIRDDFNTNYLNIDLRPSTTSIEKYKAIRRYGDLIHGQSFVESLKINGLNEFNPAVRNFKELDKQYGSIQKLISRDTDLVVLQEDKAGYVLFKKRALKNADGTQNVVTADEILGNYDSYIGENGIALNPESVGIYRNNIFYTNSKRGTPIRLGGTPIKLERNGTSEINYGVIDYFRDLFIQNPKSKKVGGIDPYTNKYFLTAENEKPERLVVNCKNKIFKTNQTNTFVYDFKLNSLGGDIVLNYNILEGNVNILANFNGTSHNVNNVTGTGTLTFTRDSLTEDIVTVTIIPLSASITYEIENVCPLGFELKVVSIVLGDSNDIGTTMLNKYKSNDVLYSDEVLFANEGVNQFTTAIGIEGVGKYPARNTNVVIKSLKDNYNTGIFDKEKCNRLGYLVTDTVYTQADINTILGLVTFLPITSSGTNNELNYGEFLFNRANNNELLYLIWDYTNRQPITADDYTSTQKGTSVTINVLGNDSDPNGLPLTPSIVTQPSNGTVIVNGNGTITYTHNDSDTLNDSFTYTVSNGICTSRVTTVNIDIAVACDESFSYDGDSTPFEVQVSFGTAIGNCGIAYEAFTIPDQFEIFYDGVLVATTGGLVSNNGTLTFNKTTATPTVATIKVTPNTDNGTRWNFAGICPNTDATARQSFLDQENTDKNIAE